MFTFSYRTNAKSHYDQYVEEFDISIIEFKTSTYTVKNEVCIPH